MVEYKYQNNFSRGQKIRRVLWNVCYYIFYRTTFSRIAFLNRWRNLLLRLWGTKTDYRCVFFPSVKIWAPWNLIVGRGVAVDECVDLYNVAPITLGNFVSISRRAFLCTASHDISDIRRPLTYKPIVVGNGVWIGASGCGAAWT